MLLTLLALWGLLQLLRPRIEPLLACLSTASTRISLSPLSLDLATTAINALPQALLHVLPRVGRAHRDRATRRLAWFYDAGALVVLVGAILAQGVLLAAACRAVLALFSVLGSSLSTRSALQLARRALAVEPPSGPTGDGASAADSLLLRPVIPGLTTPLALLPTLVGALLVSQGFHELGHALAAACEQLPLHSLNAHLYLLFLPTLSVSLPAPPSALSDLRIATAGIWHNVVLALFALAAAESGGALGRKAGVASGVWRELEEGVLLVAVDAASPLAPHLVPGARLTHFDDLELDAASSFSASGSALEMWRTYLAAPQGRTADPYENLGWCLPVADFSPTREDIEEGEGCCPALMPGDTPSAARVCFAARGSADVAARLQACLDPLALLPPVPAAQQPARTDDCASLAISPSAVTVTNLAPRYTFLPLSLPLTLDAFWSAVLSLSLALVFFNALPLPHLDGAHILSAFLAAAAGGEELPLQRRGVAGAAAEDSGLLVRTMKRVGNVGLVRRAAETRERVERVAGRWTAAVGGVTLVASGVVELVECKRRS
ncbi:hypothetical protein JCM10449v2_006864 [Rhodotorula kratochvilovae]